MSRYETYLRKIAGEDVDISNMPEPSDRYEYYLKQIAENGGGSVDPEEIAEIVTDWLDDHVDPETGYVIDNTLLVEGAAADAKKVGDELTDVKSAISVLEPTATSADVGMTLIAKSVTDGKVTEYELGEAGGGMTATAANLLLTILNEGVYGSDQTANIELLRKALMSIKPQSISAVLESTPLVGLHYADLVFTVTATFDDASTMIVDNYRILTEGSVTSGSNTVTVAFRGITTDVTFTASDATTYSITNTFTNVTSDNSAYLIVSGERYAAELTVPEGYGGLSCTVTMGGVDVTSTVYNNGNISIEEVTGDVVITASATQYTYMDDLLPARNEGFTNVYGYSGGSASGTTVCGGNYYFNAYVSTYPAKNNCTVNWKIKNISDTNASLSGTGFGSIDCISNNYYGDSSAKLNVLHCVSSTNQSNTLAPGGTLEGTVEILSGWQLVFVCKPDVFAQLELELYGDFVSDTFTGYSEIAPTSSTVQNYGSYREVSYYSDNGTTLIGKKNRYPSKLDLALEAGTYDIYYSVRVIDEAITNNFRNVEMLIGAMSANTDTACNYAGGMNMALGCNMWHHSQITVSANDMAIVATILYLDYMTATDPKLSIMYKKVVTE